LTADGFSIASPRIEGNCWPAAKTLAGFNAAGLNGIYEINAGGKSRSVKPAGFGSANTTAPSQRIIRSNFTPKDFASVAENQRGEIGIAPFAAQKFRLAKSYGAISEKTPDFRICN
jgi:hypothetical protein